MLLEELFPIVNAYIFIIWHWRHVRVFKIKIVPSGGVKPDPEQRQNLVLVNSIDPCPTLPFHVMAVNVTCAKPVWKFPCS